MLETESQPV